MGSVAVDPFDGAPGVPPNKEVVFADEDLPEPAQAPPTLELK